MNKESIRWLISFMVLTGIFYWVNQGQFFQEFLIGRLAYLNTSLSIWILSFLGLHLDQAGSTIITGSGSIEIAKSCTGSFVFMMFAAAILPFPATWKSRIKGLFWGLLALLILNLFRICMIVLVGSRFPGSIWALHLIIGQAIVIAGITAVFLWWAKPPLQGSQVSFFRNNKEILRAISLFCAGYLCGFWLYRSFLESPSGFLLKQLVDVHTLWIISSLNEIFSSGHLSQFSSCPVKLVDGCLSSPMVVVFVAVVFAWPARWWKRILIIIIGFIPFFYIYHLVRAVLISVSLGIQSKDVNLVYNFYGQLLLAMAIFAWIASIWCFKQKRISIVRFLFFLLASGLVGLAAAKGLGWLMRHFLFPFLTMRISGTPFLFYDAAQSVSLMFDLQVFIWFSLVGSTPELHLTRKSLIILLGTVVAFMFTVVTVLLIETFHLVPHKGMLQLSVVILPFAVYYLYFVYSENNFGKRS